MKFFWFFHQVKPYYIPAEQIEKELSDIVANLAQLEKEGVDLEKKLRSCEEGMLICWYVKFPVFKKKKRHLSTGDSQVALNRCPTLVFDGY